MGLKQYVQKLQKEGDTGLLLFNELRRIRALLKKGVSDKEFYNQYFRESFGRDINFENPETLNEKIQWLKLYSRKDFQTRCADKFLVREYVVEKCGEEARKHLIPLLFETSKWQDITFENLPDEPFIIKPTHTSGDYKIIRDKHNVNIKALRRLCRQWLRRDFYLEGREWQYKNCPRRIIIEKLLTTEDGHIPNDYKLHYINGQLEFVYCSIGRETTNHRKIYNAEWQPLPFLWVPKTKINEQSKGDDIPAPASFDLMKKYADIIAKDFDYVRVDFYDVDGELYFGEVTLYHGGGFDVFVPEEYDKLYGDKLILHK